MTNPSPRTPQRDRRQPARKDVRIGTPPQDGLLPGASGVSFEVDGADRASVRVLLVDDERTIRESCAGLLGTEGYSVTATGNGNEARELIRRHNPDVLVVDLFMTGVPGMELLAEALRAHPGCLVIVITGKPSVESSIEALRAGAWHYLAKPFSATHFSILMGRAAHTVMVARETERLRAGKGLDMDGLALVGQSEPFRSVIAAAHQVAPTDASVFIYGESGTGKELIARYIHEHSHRSSRDLVTVNSAAIPESLLESEMFGHVEGAFTGATREKEGLLEAANGGTLFLDEIAEMARPVQAKLLRVIQDGVVRRVGSTKVDAIVNLRFIAATNVEPLEAVDRGDLRRDLYYRLWVVPIRVPPLRERTSDIPILARHFLERFWKRYRGPELPCPVLTDEAILALKRHPWPGNVRELMNLMEHATVVLAPGSQVEPGDIPRLSEGGRVGSGNGHSNGDWLLDQEYHTAREHVLAEFERSYLRRIVTRTKGKVVDAAKIAGVDPTTLYRLMEKHELRKEDLLLDSPPEGRAQPE